MQPRRRPPPRPGPGDAAPRTGPGGPAASAEFELCALAARQVPVGRAAIALGEQAWALPGSDSALCDLIDREQTVAEGPHVEALAGGAVVRVADLRWAGRWPMLVATGAVSAAPFRSLVVLPLPAVGAGHPIGLLSMARDARVPFRDDEVALLEVVAHGVLLRLVDRWRAARQLEQVAGESGGDDRDLAVGALAAVLGIRRAEAAMVLRARALGAGATAREAARSMVDGRGDGGPPAAGRPLR